MTTLQKLQMVGALSALIATALLGRRAPAGSWAHRFPFTTPLSGWLGVLAVSLVAQTDRHDRRLCVPAVRGDVDQHPAVRDALAARGFG